MVYNKTKIHKPYTSGLLSSAAMNLKFVSNRTKYVIVSISLLAILLCSGAFANSTLTVTAQNSATSGVSSTTYPSHAPTFTGPASHALLAFGPLKTSAGDSPSSTSSSLPTKTGSMPYLNPKSSEHSGNAPASPTVPPVVNCQPQSAGCDSISGSKGGATTNPNGINAVSSGSLYGTDVEPPDQSICAGAGYVMQVENIGEMEVFNTNLASQSAVIPLDQVMGLTSIPASMGGPWSSGGDISCLYDAGNGGHWFITEIVSNSSWAVDGPFGGCFAGKLNGCFEGLAVSQTNNPLGDYNVYFINPNQMNNDPGKGYLLNDFTKIGNTNDAFLVFYDEFILNGAVVPTCPAFGCYGFNGAQELAFTKKALEEGLPVMAPTGGPNSDFNMAYENMGNDPALYPVPANGAFQSASASCFKGTYAGAVCWYQVIPAQSPDATQFDNSHGGTGFVVATLDFFGNGDNRMAVFDWTGLSALNSNGCSTCSGGGISFGGQLFKGVEAYRDEGAACLAENGGFCGLGAQKAGPIPLGNNCVAYGLNATDVSSCPENGIASNGDGATQASYANGQLWFGISTLVTQKFYSGTETHLGVAYWAVGTYNFDNDNSLTLTTQGYITAMHEDLEFPAFAATDGSTVLVTFTLNGNAGNNGGYYPSSTYGLLTSSSTGLSGKLIYTADKGKSPQDGFSEYQGYAAGTRPRWGDYNYAIYMPSSPGSSTGRIYFATEFIASPNCSNAAFLKDSSCGGTRDTYANWANSLNYLPVK